VTATFAIGIVASLLGLVYITYGKRQVKYAPLLCGVALCTYTYFVDSWILSCVIGAVLLALPFFVDG
jgi:hypothetical protein